MLITSRKSLTRRSNVLTTPKSNRRHPAKHWTRLAIFRSHPVLSLVHHCSFLFQSLTHWLLEIFWKNSFLDVSVVFRLDLGQISFNQVGNAFATQQLALLAASTAFYDISARACAKNHNFEMRKWPMCSGFSIFGILFFSPASFLLFFSFCCSD